MRTVGPLLATLVLLAGCSPDSGATSAAAPDPTPATPTPTLAPTPAPSGAAQPRAARVRPAAPVRVRIPALGLDEELLDLGIADDGSLEVPDDPGRVGWFTGGGRPGGPGPTVVVGHLDSATGPAVFARLPSLSPGDRVTVESADGTRVRYRVTRTEDVAQDAFPTERVFGATPGDELRLVTCIGDYDRAAGRYTENRVVHAVPVPG